MRRQRRGLTTGERRHAERLICQRLLTLVHSRRYSRVACYLDADGEVPTRGLISRLHNSGVKVYLPVLCRTSKRLSFRRYAPSNPLRPNRYGLLEPVPRQAAQLGIKQLDAVLLPLVGFDRRGNRLGMGGGFYDTTFAFLYSQFWQPLHLIGLAYELQRVEDIPTDPWDISVHNVVTESRIY